MFSGNCSNECYFLLLTKNATEHWNGSSTCVKERANKEKRTFVYGIEKEKKKTAVTVPSFVLSCDSHSAVSKKTNNSCFTEFPSM